ncbi:MAG: hypothetical protein NT180_04495 [Actinobacteria bacterium]|nr:hypothetical protein [Actinomycetota bacterium]
MSTLAEILDSDVTGFEVVYGYVLTFGSVHSPTVEIRGRDAIPSLLLSEDTALTAMHALWVPERVFAIRSIPALRFDSTAGSLLVADLWGDAGYWAFTYATSRHLLTLGIPMSAIATAAEQMRVGNSRRPPATILLRATTPEETTILPPRGRLPYVTSMMIDDYFVGWAQEQNRYPRTPINTIRKIYSELNPVPAHAPTPDRTEMSTASRWRRWFGRKEKASSPSRDLITADADAGIAELEAYLRSKN